MGVTIIDNDRGYKQLLTNVRKMGTTVVKVGVNNDPHEGSPGMTNADVGALHEFGLGNNRQRSFLRAWVDENERGIAPWLRERVYAFLLGRGDWAKEFGEYCVAGIRQRIMRGIEPELQEATVKRKGGNDTPLVDTHQLIDAIEYEVSK